MALLLRSSSIKWRECSLNAKGSMASIRLCDSCSSASCSRSVKLSDSILVSWLCERLRTLMGMSFTKLMGKCSSLLSDKSRLMRVKSDEPLVGSRDFNLVPILVRMFDWSSFGVIVSR